MPLLDQDALEGLARVKLRGPGRRGRLEDATQRPRPGKAFLLEGPAPEIFALSAFEKSVLFFTLYLT
jgi:hypothetical protein